MDHRPRLPAAEQGGGTVRAAIKKRDPLAKAALWKFPSGNGLDLVVHAAAAVVRISRRLFFLFRDLGDHGLGREQQARDGGGVL